MVRVAFFVATSASILACDLRGPVPLDPAPGAEREPAVGPAGTAEPSASIAILDDSEGVPSTRFQLYELDDLAFEVTWDVLPDDGSTTQSLQIHSPDGVLYLEVTAPAGENLRHVLPIAGTSISRHAITGNWWVELRLVGKASAVAAAEFVISSAPPAEQ